MEKFLAKEKTYTSLSSSISELEKKGDLLKIENLSLKEKLIELKSDIFPEILSNQKNDSHGVTENV